MSSTGRASGFTVGALRIRALFFGGGLGFRV